MANTHQLTFRPRAQANSVVLGSREAMRIGTPMSDV